MQTSSRVPAHKQQWCRSHRERAMEERWSILPVPFTIKSAERLCLISSGGETKLYRAGVLKGEVRGWWWRRWGGGGTEAAVAVCLCNSATYERWGPSPALGGAPDSPCLIFEGWGCLNNSSQSSQCPARHHLSPQECG